MPINKVVIMIPGQIGRFSHMISTAHLHLCENKLHIVELPKEKDVLSNIAQLKTFENMPVLRAIFNKDFKTLLNIYKKVQRKYYPEKDIYSRFIK